MQIAKVRYFAYRRRLVVGSGLLLILLALALSWKVRASYLEDRRTAEAQTKNFVRAMDAHVTNAIEIVDLALIRSAGVLKSLEPDQLENADVVRQSLAASGRSPDTNFWLIFLDADGKGVVASNGLPIAGISYADRPYFATHARGVDTGLFVGEPQVGKVSRRRLFFLSRPVLSPSGRFLGVVAAPVDASVLAGVFQNALFGPGLAVTLVHRDGTVIARAPKFEESFASDLSKSPLFERLETAPSGTFEATSIVDGATRLYAYESLDGLPLVIVVGMASAAWTAGLVDDLLVATVGLTVIFLILWFSGRFALSSFQRLNASEATHRLLAADLRAARERLAGSEERMRIVTDHVPALVAYVDADERYVFRNAAYTEYEGIAADAMIGRTLLEVHGEADYRLVADEIAQALAGQTVVFERERRTRGVTRHWKHAYTPDVVDGRVVGLYTVVTDLTERKGIEQGLRSLARIDTLTGLPNRHQLYEQLQIAIARTRRASTKIACFYLDLDHFKHVNDTLGHAAGDELLRQFAARLQASVRETDLVARIAGDEFVIVGEGVECLGDAVAIAKKVIEAMQIPFVIDGAAQAITTSIGGVVSTGRDETPDSLLKQADGLLYLAKRSGKNQFRIVAAAADAAVDVASPLLPTHGWGRLPPVSSP